jgi:hypothetical protein
MTMGGLKAGVGHVRHRCGLSRKNPAEPSLPAAHDARHEILGRHEAFRIVCIVRAQALTARGAAVQNAPYQ